MDNKKDLKYVLLNAEKGRQSKAELSLDDNGSKTTPFPKSQPSTNLKDTKEESLDAEFETKFGPSTKFYDTSAEAFEKEPEKPEPRGFMTDTVAEAVDGR